MEEQSHKDEMRAALRGDFERLRLRRVGDSHDASEHPTSTEISAPVQRESTELVERSGSWLDRLRGRG